MAKDKYVVQGARMSCSASQTRSIFQCINAIHNIQGSDLGTAAHFIPVLNVPPFGQQCQILTAAALGTPTPCVPFPGKWQGTFAGHVSNGFETLLKSSFTMCTFGGLIEFTNSGQPVATTSNQFPQPLVLPTVINQGAAPNNLPVLPRAPLAPALPPPYPVGTTIKVLDPGNKANGWTSELNQVPLEADAQYLVGKYLYKTDTEGRVKEVHGVLVLQPHERNTYQQGIATKKKTGKRNPQFVSDIRTPQQKDAASPQYVADARTDWQKREYVDEGGHLVGAQFDGPGEQINYVPLHINQNKANPANQDNWHKMESNWAKDMKAGRQVYTKIFPRYPNPLSKRPHRLQVIYWVDGEKNNKTFVNS